MKRVQIVCIGSSSLYGVGGTKGGWADLFKLDLHKEQYGPNGVGQIHEIYNLGIPGATIENFMDRVEIDLISARKPGRKLVTVMQLGSNNTMAVNQPTNYITTHKEFEQLVRKILLSVQKNSDTVLWVGMNLMDESKVMPIQKDKEKNRKVYFPNNRKIEFDLIAKKICKEMDVKHVDLIEKQQKLNWFENYQYIDGIHPNDKGHQWIYEQIKPEVLKLIEE